MAVASYSYILHKISLNYVSGVYICLSIQFLPDKRQDAGRFVELLKPLQIQVMK